MHLLSLPFLLEMHKKILKVNSVQKGGWGGGGWGWNVSQSLHISPVESS